MQNYAKRFYNSNKNEERNEILSEISNNIQAYGYNIAADEIMRRFKNMKAHYRRKKEDLATGTIKKIEWEYFELIDDIFKDTLIAKQRTKAQVKAFDVTAVQSSVDPSPTVKESPSEVAKDHAVNTLKRPSDQHEEAALEIKKEKLVRTESPELIVIDEKKTEPPAVPSPPLSADTSLKRTKVIQFNNIADITSQLPITSMALTTEDSKRIAIKRIALELKKLDAQRLELDEKRLNLEIERNEIDKAAYMLTEILAEITKQ